MKKYLFKPYNESFPRLFKKEQERIAAHIKQDLSIEHVGSTAVPNLGGKGIIDIAIAIGKNEATAMSKKLQELGYELKLAGSTSSRLFFTADLPDPEEGIRRYHVHLTDSQSQDWEDLISFREYLKKHPEEALKYSEVKKMASKEVNDDGAMYRKMKEPTFERILKKTKVERFRFKPLE